MTLELQPALTEQTRATIEAHLEEVRTRRMIAAMEYASGVNAKVNFESDKLAQRMSREYDGLMKDMARLDQIDEKIQKRLGTIEAIKASQGILRDAFIIMDTEEETGE